MSGKLRVALIHDAIIGVGGSEYVLLQLHKMFPEAPLYTAIFDPSRQRDKFEHLQIRTSFLQPISHFGPRYEMFVPLVLPLAYENFDLRGFDLVVSSSHAFSKGVIPPADALHLCYCHTPIRYAWSHREEYLAHVPLRPLLSPIARLIIARLRRWDYIAAQRVDCYVASSRTVQKRIAKYYRRRADVVYPPVDLERFHFGGTSGLPQDSYLVVSRLVEYKRTEVAVEACTRLSLPLKVVGRGPQLGRLRRIAGPTIEFVGELDDRGVESAYRSCRALIFPPDEDFGLAPVEAMASGRPVLALNAGGARETVVPGVTGELYDDGGVDALTDALQRFQPGNYDPASCRARAEEFSATRFRGGIAEILERELGRKLT